MTDLILAILHHLLVFGLVAHLAIELAVTRPGINARQLRRLARADMIYGITAGLVVAVGVLRVIFGTKGAPFYLGNPWFWGKMVSFAAIGLVSILPTVRILGWAKASRIQPEFTPDAAAIKPVRTALWIEIALLAPVLICAAAMARYGGF